MKLQYGILGMTLVSGAAFAHDMDAEGIQVGGYVDARYTWANSDVANTFSIAEGSLYAGKKVGGAQVFIDVPFTGAGIGTFFGGGAGGQAYVSSASDMGFTWKSGIFDGIYGWTPNDSGHYWLSGRGLIQSSLPITHGGVMMGYSFSDMLSLNFLVAADIDGSTVAGRHNMDQPEFGMKFDSEMEAFNLGLGFLIEKSDALPTGNHWGMDLVAGTKFGEYDFQAIFVMEKDGAGDAMIGFGTYAGGMFTETLSAALRIEWMKVAANSNVLAFTLGPQCHIEKGFVVKTDYTFAKAGGSANTGSKAGHAIQVAAVYDF